MAQEIDEARWECRQQLVDHVDYLLRPSPFIYDQLVVEAYELEEFVEAARNGEWTSRPDRRAEEV